MNKKYYPNAKEILPNDSRKSFYGKAWEYEENGKYYLVSYDTVVAQVSYDGECVVKGLYSATTTRHIKAFLTAHNIKDYTFRVFDFEFMGEIKKNIFLSFKY